LQRIIMRFLAIDRMTDLCRRRALADLFWQPISRVLLLVFLLVSATTGDKNQRDFKALRL
jgi:hypothetical protein